jgi:ketosteroid isomerase-like protein
MISPSQQSDASRNVALGFFENVVAGRFKDAFELLAPDVAFEIIAPAPYGRTMDRDGLIAYHAEVMAPAFAAPLTVTVTGVTAEGERVAIETRAQSTTKQGKRYDNRLHYLLIVRNGKITEVREYLDSAALLAVFAPA